MSADLASPDAELARRLEGTVPYAQRLRVGRLTPPVGLLAGHVRSLAELRLHLEPDQRSLPGVNLGGVAAWVEGAIGDGDLAGQVRELDASVATYVDKCLRLSVLVGARLQQAREVVGEVGSATRDGDPPREGGGA